MVKRKNRRPLESIIYPDGLLRSLVQDVKDFFTDGKTGICVLGYPIERIPVIRAPGNRKK